MAFNTITVTVVGFRIGKMIYLNTWNLLHPSMIAASSNAIGIPLSAPKYKKMDKLEAKPKYIIINPKRFSMSKLPKIDIRGIIID